MTRRNMTRDLLRTAEAAKVLVWVWLIGSIAGGILLAADGQVAAGIAAAIAGVTAAAVMLTVVSYIEWRAAMADPPAARRRSAARSTVS